MQYNCSEPEKRIAEMTAREMKLAWQNLARTCWLAIFRMELLAKKSHAPADQIGKTVRYLAEMRDWFDDPAFLGPVCECCGQTLPIKDEKYTDTEDGETSKVCTG